MCNAYEQQVSFAAYREAVGAADLATPNGETAELLPASDEIRIGDTGPVLVAAGNGAELRLMTFGWPPPRPKSGPVFNFKSDGRNFTDSRRCVIVLSGFFEFVGTKYPKAKYRFSLSNADAMGIAGLWSEAEDGTPSFTMLTIAPGPDIEPYHDRQVCVLHPSEWAAWLYLTRPQDELLRPLPAGSLTVDKLRDGSD